MARYFFDFFDGTVMRDPIGHECAGYEDIRHEAMKALPEIAKGAIPQDGTSKLIRCPFATRAISPSTRRR